MTTPAKALTAQSGSVVAIRPILDVDNATIIALMITITIRYKDMVGLVTTAGQEETFDAWPLLSGTQQSNMQDIRNTVAGYVASTYFGA
jgi:hypothetical protein